MLSKMSPLILPIARVSFLLLLLNWHPPTAWARRVKWMKSRRGNWRKGKSPLPGRWYGAHFQGWATGGAAIIITWRRCMGVAGVRHSTSRVRHPSPPDQVPLMRSSRSPFHCEAFHGQTSSPSPSKNKFEVSGC